MVHPDGKWKNVTFDGLVEEVDLSPTLLEILGIDAPPTMVGKSLVEFLDKKDYSGKETIICEAGGGAPTWKEPIEGFTINAPHVPTSYGTGAMIRKGDYKLSIYSDDRCELYDLSTDKHELNNLYDNEKYSEIQTELTLLLLKRTMGTKQRDVGLEWDYSEYMHDVRFEPIECVDGVLQDIRASE